jgi:hypothetical protein
MSPPGVWGQILRSATRYQKVWSRASRRSGALPAAIAELIAPMETPGRDGAALDKRAALLYGGQIQLKQRSETLVGPKGQDETAGVYGYEHHRAARGRTGR